MADTRGNVTRLVRRVAVVAVTCTLVPVVVVWLLQDRLVYGGDDVRYPIDRGGAPVEDVGYTTADGVELRGWFVRHRSERSGCSAPPTVVVFHGSFTNMTWGYPLASSLADRGFDVFLAEYRGFGGMPGSPSEDGLRLDALAAVDAARAQSGDAAIVLMGLSLGTGVAVTVPPEQSRAVYAASGHPDGLVELEGQGHLGALHEVVDGGDGAVISAVRRWAGCRG